MREWQTAQTLMRHLSGLCNLGLHWDVLAFYAQLDVPIFKQLSKFAALHLPYEIEH